MKTIEELEKFLEEESYSFIELSIGNHFAPQGIVINIFSAILKKER